MENGHHLAEELSGPGAGANRFAKRVEEMSAGRIKIKVYGAKELVPAFEVFDAVRQGSAEMGHGAAYYWKGKHPATPFSPPCLRAHRPGNEWLAAPRWRPGAVG